MKKNLKTELLTIGDELLLGIRTNTHLQYIGKSLTDNGIELNYCGTIGDDFEALKSAFVQSIKRADLIIATGGLGPTTDDITREAIAAALKVKLIHDPAVKKAIYNRLQDMPVIPRSILKECKKPEGFEVLMNLQGTAPGLFYHKKGKTIVLLPGPPCEMRTLFETEVLPRLQKIGLCCSNELYLQIRTCGAKEAIVAEKISPILKKHPIRVSYCIHDGLVDIRLSPKKNSKISHISLRNFGLKCAEALEDDFVCFGENTIPGVIIGQLLTMQKSISVAESCTGGLLSHEFTTIPGAHKVFKGSITAYTHEVKEELLSVPIDVIEQHDMVSEEVVTAMAVSAAEKFLTDYALSITGYAGPTTMNASIPVGTVFIGYHSPSGTRIRRLFLEGSRLEIQKKATLAALDFMRRQLNEYRIADFIKTLDI